MVEADASEAEAALNALLGDEASKLRILDYLRKWARRQVGRNAWQSRLELSNQLTHAAASTSVAGLPIAPPR